MAQRDSLARIGNRLRDERQRLDLTLDQLAALSGISKPHLSRLESGERQPSLAALLDLAAALGVPVSSLLGEDHEGPSILITPAADTSTHSVNGLSVGPLSGYPGSNVLDALCITIEADRAASAPVRHDGEELIHVLSGVLHLEYDGAIHELMPGASAHFDATRLHRLAASGGPATVLMVTGHHARDMHLIHR